MAAALATEVREPLVSPQRMSEALAGDGLSMVYQPIVDLGDGEVVGFEALARFRGEVRSPAEWFVEASVVGLRTELELAAVLASLSDLDFLHPSRFLAVNVSPATVCSSDLRDVLGDDADRVVLEITEHAPVEDYDALCSCVRALRDDGVRFAIDDVGAGFSSLRHVLRLAPEFVKLDRSLTHEIAHDSRRRALAASLVVFATSVGATIVAEGIEGQADLDELRELGMDYGQGYYLGRPSAFPFRETQRVDRSWQTDTRLSRVS